MFSKNFIAYMIVDMYIQPITYAYAIQPIAFDENLDSPYFRNIRDIL